MSEVNPWDKEHKRKEKKRLDLPCEYLLDKVHHLPPVCGILGGSTASWSASGGLVLLSAETWDQIRKCFFCLTDKDP